MDARQPPEGGEIKYKILPFRGWGLNLLLIILHRKTN
jgi:hypothetical protein